MFDLSIRSITSFAFVVLAILFTMNFQALANQTGRDAASFNDIIIDGTTGNLFNATPHGLKRSDDDGRSWDQVPVPDVLVGDDEITALVISTGGKGVMYLGSVANGVFRTMDGGKSWAPMSNGLPTIEVIALASHAELPKTLYALLANNNIYRSQDAAGSWQLMDEGPAGISRLIHTNMEGSMQTGWLFAATNQGVQRSMDCFCLWRQAGDLSGKISNLSYHPGKPEQVYAINDGELFQSKDGGENWTQPKSPRANLVSLAISPTGIIFAITNNGDVIRSVDDAKTWSRVGA